MSLEKAFEWQVSSLKHTLIGEFDRCNSHDRTMPITFSLSPSFSCTPSAWRCFARAFCVKSHWEVLICDPWKKLVVKIKKCPFSLHLCMSFIHWQQELGASFQIPSNYFHMFSSTKIHNLLPIHIIKSIIRSINKRKIILTIDNFQRFFQPFIC